MKEIKTVASVLESIRPNPAVKDNGKTNHNRFSKKAFNELLTAMVNDPDFTTDFAVSAKGELKSVEEIRVTEGFRKWLQKVVEIAGIDKAESAVVLSKDFVIPNMDGLYELFTTAMYEYMKNGSRFDMIPKKDFKASFAMNKKAPKTKTGTLLNPSTGEVLGTYSTDMAEHWEASVKSSCPNWMKKRMKTLKK
jgi:hypothetical protein